AVVAHAAGVLGLHPEVLELELGLLDVLAALAFALVLFAKRPQLLLDVAGVLLGLGETRLGGVVLLARQGVDLNLELAQATLERVDDLGLRLAGDADGG